jgi:hypothetical protein
MTDPPALQPTVKSGKTLTTSPIRQSARLNLTPETEAPSAAHSDLDRARGAQEDTHCQEKDTQDQRQGSGLKRPYTHDRDSNADEELKNNDVYI